MPKPLSLSDPMKVRWERQGKTWKGIRCLICGKTWKDEAQCPHSAAQNERVNQLLRDREGLI